MKCDRLSFSGFLPALFLVLLFPVLTVSCSDDAPPERSEYDIIGIWQDREGHIFEFADPDNMYEYDLMRQDEWEAWVKRKEMYFFEPYSYIMMREDSEGAMQVYQVVSVSDDELVICWVATPDFSGLEGDDKFQLFSVFFKQDYIVDPARYETFHRLTNAELAEALEGYDLIDLDETTGG